MLVRAMKRRRAHGLPAVAEAGVPSYAELRRIAERILKLSEADETEVTIDAGANALTRFANNTIHQHVAKQFLSISVRVLSADCAAFSANWGV